MYLLLGSPQDLCCLGVQAALEARGHQTRIVSNPFAYPFRFAWQLTNDESTSQLVLDQESPLSHEDITGVLVRRSGWIDPNGWETEDLAYMQLENQAALLAWLWSLPCPVVNRYPASIWYESHPHPLSWNRLLRRCGLPTPKTLITNVDDESRAFGQQLAGEGVAGVVYGPHVPAQFVCVVGAETIWEGEPPPEADELEPALHSFATAAGLAFVALAFARTHQGLCVIAVEPHPYLEHFGDRARQEIADGLVTILTANSGFRSNSAVQTFQRRCVPLHK